MPIDELLAGGEPFVRLYSAPVRGFSLFATHPWFVVRREPFGEVNRWEVTHRGRKGELGFVRLNFREPEQEVGGGAAFILAELRGDAAEPVADFIETRSPDYPCRYEYSYYPGPNSNTYAQWILDETGWDVELPPTAIGRNLSDSCRTEQTHGARR